MENVGGLVGGLFGGLIGALFTSVLLFVIGRFNLGIKLDNFGAAFLTAILMGLLTLVLNWIWGLLGYTPPSGGLAGFITAAVSSAAILMTAGAFVKGLKVNGFVGALIASAAIGGLSWLINFVISKFA